MGFVSYPYLVFVISVLTFKVTVALNFFGSKHILSTEAKYASYIL